MNAEAKFRKLSNLFTEGVIVHRKKHLGCIIKKCHHCVIYRAMPFPSPKPRPLPKQAAQECHPFHEIGVDYAGPIYDRSKNKAKEKSYILLFPRSVSRAVHLELVPNIFTQEFIKSMKRLRARRGTPKIILTLRRHSRLGLSGLPELTKTRSFTIF